MNTEAAALPTSTLVAIVAAEMLQHPNVSLVDAQAEIDRRLPAPATVDHRPEWARNLKGGDRFQANVYSHGTYAWRERIFFGHHADDGCGAGIDASDGWYRYEDCRPAPAAVIAAHEAKIADLQAALKEERAKAADLDRKLAAEARLSDELLQDDKVDADTIKRLTEALRQVTFDASAALVWAVAGTGHPDTATRAVKALAKLQAHTAEERNAAIAERTALAHQRNQANDIIKAKNAEIQRLNAELAKRNATIAERSKHSSAGWELAGLVHDIASAVGLRIEGKGRYVDQGPAILAAIEALRERAASTRPSAQLERIAMALGIDTTDAEPWEMSGDRIVEAIEGLQSRPQLSYLRGYTKALYDADCMTPEEYTRRMAVMKHEIEILEREQADAARALSKCEVES